ncbi:MAG: tetratricopeptide repeat protein [Magnetospirillum sp.]|nr:tetratricopeptide repeat protein [Magnetospirillum sp.]
MGRSYRTLGRYDAAIDALRRAADLGPPNADLLGTLGEVVVASAQGMVVPEARQVFLETLGVQPGDPRARFYLGLARAQIGDAAGAIAVWKDLEQDSSPDVPWLTELRDEIAQTAATAGLDAATIAPKPETALTGTAAP